MGLRGRSLIDILFRRGLADRIKEDIYPSPAGRPPDPFAPPGDTERRRLDTWQEVVNEAERWRGLGIVPLTWETAQASTESFLRSRGLEDWLPAVPDPPKDHATWVLTRSKFSLHCIHRIDHPVHAVIECLANQAVLFVQLSDGDQGSRDLRRSFLTCQLCLSSTEAGAAAPSEGMLLLGVHIESVLFIGDRGRWYGAVRWAHPRTS